MRRAGRVIETSPTEFKLLRYLMLNPNRVLSKAQILDHVWDYDFRGESGIVESYISYLRRKIDTEGLPPLIHTKRGVGYVLRLPLRADGGRPRTGLRRPVRWPRRPTTRGGPAAAAPRRRSWAPSSGRRWSSRASCHGVPHALRPHGPGRRRAAVRGPPRRPARRCATCATRGSALPTNYAFELQSHARHVPAPADRARPRRPMLPDLSVDDPRVTSGEPFTVPSEGGRARVALHRRPGDRRGRDLRRRHPARPR